MGREEWVLQRWRCLCSDLGIENALSERWGKKIQGGYSEQGRHYHNLEHVADMLENADRDLDNFHRPHLVQLAIFFHDLVYDPRSGSNEEDSEVLFCTFAEAAELNVADTRTVSDYIFATKLHNVMDSDDQDLRAFIDLDMAVIGRDRSGYLAYASQIRDEYLHVPADTYCRKRAEILTEFLTTDSIFATEKYRRDMEALARDNVEAELALLRAGAIPGHT